MAKIVSGVAVLIIALLVLFFVFRGDDEADAEAQYDGVHLCSPSQQAAGTAQARARDSVPEALGSGEAPYFAQNSAAWGGEEYDHGGSQNVGCGQTIAQCGCAMTSVATVMHLFEVVTTPGEDPLTPSTLNAWFNQNAQLTSEGWVSAGYVFGNVVWTAINGWTPTAVQEAVEDDDGDSERASPDSRAAAEAQVPQGMRFAGWGSGSEEEIRRELEAGRPVVIEVPGHYVAAVALQDSRIVINDPAYRERTTLDAYAGRVLSARLFEPSDDFRSILVSVPSNLRIEVTDEQGRTVGTLEGTDPAEADNNAAAEMPGAVYQFQGMWRDPTCTERPPPDGAGINSVFISFPETGKYTVVVVNPEGGDTAAAVHMSDVKGTQRIEVHEGGSQTTFEIDYDAGADTAPPTTPTPTPTPTATPEDDTPTPTPLPPSVTPQPPTATPTDTPTITPTITPTPTATTVPLDITSFDIVLDEVNQGDPCRILLSWTVTGNPEGTVRLLKQFGTSLNNNTAEVLIEGGPGQGSYIDGFLVGPWTYRVLATSPQQITSDTLTVRPICIRLFSAKGGDAYSVDVSWHIQGEMPGATYTLSRAGCCVLSTGSVNYGTTQTYTDTNFDLGCGPDNPRQYVLSVNVAARTVTTNSITAIAPCPVIF